MKIIILISALFLSSCSLAKLDPTNVSAPVRLITVTLYPELPSLSKPASLNLMTPAWDVPRDTKAKLTVKKLSNCLKVSKEKRDTSFWVKCGEYPPIANSNIYRGFTYDNFNIFLENNLKIRNKLKAYSERINVVNKQRQEWHELNLKQQKIINNTSKN